MNTMLHSKIKTQEPKIEGLKEKNLYLGGLTALAAIVSEGFFNMPEAPANPGDKFNLEGLLYEIPFFTSDTLCSVGNKIDLVIVYEIIKNKGNASLHCPLRIEFDFTDIDNYKVAAIRQADSGNKKTVLYGKESGNAYTEVKVLETTTLLTFCKLGGI